MAALKLGVVSTFPPREDGIATFTRDLLDAIGGAESDITARVAAITDPPSFYPYGRQVRWEVEQGNRCSFAEAGRLLSHARMDVASLQHEFGLFGRWGDPILDYAPALLEALRVPLVTTLHTVLPQPRADIREAVRRLCERSAAVVVMVGTGAKILVEDYGIERERVVVIPHGVPAVRPADAEAAKRSLRLAGHTVICTFGLLSRNKGIENMIRAMPAVLERRPDALYLVMGETHPQVRRFEGESYRKELKALAGELGVSREVRFIDEYLTQEHLIRYLHAADIYVTPYHDRNQITSGTLSYALGCGCAIISTPYVYAAEALVEGRGLLAEFDSPASLARCVGLYLENPALWRDTRERARAYGRQMAWPRVGERYAELLRRVVAAAGAPKRRRARAASAVSGELAAVGGQARANGSVGLEDLAPAHDRAAAEPMASARPERPRPQRRPPARAPDGAPARRSALPADG